MAKITISAYECLYNGAIAPAYARAYYKTSYVTDDGQSILAGDVGSANFVKQVAVTYTNGVAQIASFSNAATDNRLDSTINASSSRVMSTVILTLHDARGRYLATVLDNIKIPTTPTTTTWLALSLLSVLMTIPYRSEYYNREQITALLAGLQTASLASDTVIGRARLKTTPAYLLNPIAVGDNDTRLLTNLSDYDGTLEDAVTSIESSKVILSVTEAVSLSDNLTIPQNILLDVRALITIASGKVLTVGALKDNGNMQKFAGGGTVIFTQGAVNHFNLAWLVGAESSAPTAAAVTTAINTMITSTIYSNGGVLYFPPGTWTTNGGHVLSDAMFVKGNSSYATAGANGTRIKMNTGSSNDYIFKVGEGEYSIYWEDIVIDGNSVATTDGVLFEGASPGTSGAFGFNRVTFAGCTNGVYFHSTGGSWQTAQIAMYDCIFQSNAASGIKWNSLNGALTCVNTNFAIPANAIGLDFAACGLVRLINSEFAGANAASSKVMVISGAHGAITFDGCQDENCLTLVQNDASDISGIINFVGGSLLQSKIQINQTCMINIKDSNLMSYALQGSPSGGIATVKDCYIREVSVNDGVTVVSPAVLSAIGSTTFTVVTENLSTLGKHITRMPQKFVTPLNQLGSPSTPTVTIGHYPDTTDEDKILLRLGRLDSAETGLYYYDFYRDFGSGYLHISGNQADPNKLVAVNCPISVPDEAYSAITWNANLQVPTKSSIRNKIEAVLTALTIGTTVQAWSANLDEYSTVNPTAAGLALLDDANAAAQLVTLGINATAAELNQLNDVSAYQESVTAAGALSVTKVYSGVALTGAGAVTLAVPDASMLGQIKTIEMTTDNGDVTLALTNVVGGSAATTCTFNDVRDSLILLALSDKWLVIKEFGVSLV